ncbi:MAG TPA: hypothetical protein VNP95_01070 [Thermomicrobiales bacterium]|nr:hypothetical protein [Thermomicrobiales bacterium]
MNAERYEQLGTATLVTATGIVAASILADGQLAKALNGVGGLTWFASSALLVMAGRQSPKHRWQWAATIGLTAAVAFVIKPTDLTLATVGFGATGLAIGMAAKADPILWAKLIPGLYLPMHIGTAILKAVGRSALGMEASIRSEPPPTAAVVPFVMVVAAVAGGFLASALRERGVGLGKRRPAS